MTCDLQQQTVFWQLCSVLRKSRCTTFPVQRYEAIWGSGGLYPRILILVAPKESGTPCAEDRVKSGDGGEKPLAYVGNRTTFHRWFSSRPGHCVD